METGKSSFEMGKRRGFYQALVYEFIGSAIVTWAFNIGAKDNSTRAVAYFIGYLFAVNVSGAHFNPATSLAVYLTEKDSKDKNHKLLYFLEYEVLDSSYGDAGCRLLLRRADRIHSPKGLQIWDTRLFH